MNQFEKITHDVNIMGGKACISGTRVTVGMIIGQLSEGKTAEMLVGEYPYLSIDDIFEALKYAAWVLNAEEMSIKTA